MKQLAKPVTDDGMTSPVQEPVFVQVPRQSYREIRCNGFAVVNGVRITLDDLVFLPADLVALESAAVDELVTPSRYIEKCGLNLQLYCVRKDLLNTDAFASSR